MIVKKADFNQKVHQQNGHTSVQSPSAGPHGIAVMPPAYRMDLVDHGIMSSNKGQVLQTKLTINEPGDVYEREADRVADQVMRTALPQQLQRKTQNSVAPGTVPPIVHEVLHSAGQPLDTTTRMFMEPRFGHDLSHVRVHTDGKAAQSAAAVNALAYTAGRDVVFGTGQYAPGTNAGLRLIAHELAHVGQQQGLRSMQTGAQVGKSANGEVQIQRKVALRDVGKGEQSGFARLSELVERLNTISQGLIFSAAGNELNYELRVGGTLSNFDLQMKKFIDVKAVIPVRLTNRHGLLGNRVAGFHDQVDVDAWQSGYVDIDDLLASTDLGLQSVLVHFLRERSATPNYSRRIGGTNFTQVEFNRVHGRGIEAEAQLLRDFFGDPTIRIVNDSPSPTIRRVFRNRRGDLIRRRVSLGRGAERGVDAMSIDVRTRGGKLYTAEEYRQILEAERVARQVVREGLSGATEHRENGRGIPGP